MIHHHHRQHAGYGNGRCHHDRAAHLTRRMLFIVRMILPHRDASLAIPVPK
jgi:hypothetical protein